MSDDTTNAGGDTNEDPQMKVARVQKELEEKRARVLAAQQALITNALAADTRKRRWKFIRQNRKRWQRKALKLGRTSWKAAKLPFREIWGTLRWTPFLFSLMRKPPEETPASKRQETTPETAEKKKRVLPILIGLMVVALVAVGLGYIAWWKLITPALFKTPSPVSVANEARKALEKSGALTGWYVVGVVGLLCCIIWLLFKKKRDGTDGTVRNAVKNSYAWTAERLSKLIERVTGGRDGIEGRHHLLSFPYIFAATWLGLGFGLKGYFPGGYEPWRWVWDGENANMQYWLLFWVVIPITIASVGLIRTLKNKILTGFAYGVLLLFLSAGFVRYTNTTWWQEKKDKWAKEEAKIREVAAQAPVRWEQCWQKPVDIAGYKPEVRTDCSAAQIIRNDEFVFEFVVPYIDNYIQYQSRFLWDKTKGPHGTWCQPTPFKNPLHGEWYLLPDGHGGYAGNMRDQFTPKDTWIPFQLRPVRSVH